MAKLVVDRSTLKTFFLLRTKGFNNSVVADKLGVSRRTVQKWCKHMRDMDKREHFKLVAGVMLDHKIDFRKENGRKKT